MVGAIGVYFFLVVFTAVGTTNGKQILACVILEFFQFCWYYCWSSTLCMKIDLLTGDGVTVSLCLFFCHFEVGSTRGNTENLPTLC